MTRRPQAFYESMRDAFSGATIRALADIRDAGESFLARVVSLTGGIHYDTTGDADVWVHVVDELTGHPSQVRLFIPSNILFALPEEDDTCMVVHPRDVRVPGGSYALHGDGGDKARFPSWIATKVGLFTKKILRLESKDQDVEIATNGGTRIRVANDGSVFIDAPSGKDVTINGGTQKVARVDDHIVLKQIAFTPGTGGAGLSINGTAIGVVAVDLDAGVVSTGADRFKG